MGLEFDKLVRRNRDVIYQTKSRLLRKGLTVREINVILAKKKREHQAALRRHVENIECHAERAEEQPDEQPPEQPEEQPPDEPEENIEIIFAESEDMCAGIDWDYAMNIWDRT